MTLLATLRNWLLSFARRRAYQRAASSLLVEWRTFGSGVHHVSELADLSDGGAFVRTVTPQPLGSTIVIDLATSRGALGVPVHARVAWMAPGGMGLSFVGSLVTASL